MIIHKSIKQMEKEVWQLITISYVSSFSLLTLTVINKSVDFFYIVGGGLMALTSLLAWKAAYKLVKRIKKVNGTKEPE
ncbi:hypothetical protein G9L00_004297 [Salmonella enterica subsp. enterica serovar Ohio]|nr:hypothetical protein [Salmonella enterica subsp. enterica serovar Ohio]